MCEEMPGEKEGTKEEQTKGMKEGTTGGRNERKWEGKEKNGVS